ncbi:unnamed protein product [Urochloa humidicola]
MPKPNASLFGSAKTEMGFLSIPESDFKLETPEPAPTALVKVTGGVLDAEIVQVELAKLNRADWRWEALRHGDDSFLVVFPSDEELKRMADVEFRLKNHGVTLTISEWQDASDIIPAYHLDEVWVHIKGVPYTWRHYLAFWALGTVIGATLEVDMLTYRKKGVIRVLAGMLNRSLLPHMTDVVFGKEGYNVTFTLEEDSFQPAVPAPPIQYPYDRDDKGAEEDGTQGPEDTNKAVKKIKKH